MPGDDTFTERVTPQPGPSANIDSSAATPAAFGATIGQGAENIAEVAQRENFKQRQLAQEAQAQAEHTQNLAISNQYDSFEINKLHDPETGLLNQNLGPQAHGAIQKTLQDFDDLAAKQQATLNDPTGKQQATVAAMTAVKRNDLERTLFRYEVGQNEKYANEQDQTKMANTTTLAVQNANDPAAALHQIEVQKTVVAEAGKRQQLDPDTIAKNQFAAASSTHLAVMRQQIATGNMPLAEAWYNQHKTELDARDLTEATALVDKGSVAAQAQAQTDQILKPKDDGSPATLSDAIPKINAIADVRIRDETQSRVLRQLDIQQQATRQDQKRYFDQGLSIVQDPGNLIGIKSPAAMVLEQKMGPENWATLQSMDVKNQKREAPTTDLQTYAKLSQMVHNPSTPKGTDLTPYMPNLSPEDFKHFANAFAEKDQGKVGPEMAGILTNREVATGMMKSLKIDPDSELGMQFQLEVDQRVRLAEKQKGAKLDPKETKDIVDDMQINKVRQTGILWNGAEQPLWQIPEKNRANVSLPTLEYAQRDLEGYAQDLESTRGEISAAGGVPDKVSPEQLNALMAQKIVLRQLKKAGDIQGAAAAGDRYRQILLDIHRLPPGEKAGESADEILGGASGQKIRNSLQQGF